VRSWPKALRVLVAAALTLNVLDLTSTLRPSFIDHLRETPPRSDAALWLQLALAVVAAVLLVRAIPALAGTVRALPIPRPATAVLGLFLTVNAVHVALRQEHYPFSNVGMFSSAVPDDLASTPVRSDRRILVLEPTGVRAMSFLLEGTPWFGRYAFDFDYKAGWIMHLYATSYSRALAIVTEVLTAQGLPPPRILQIAWSTATGELIKREAPPAETP
jgi:hypothetical protein